MAAKPITGIVVVSDRCSRGRETDLTGPRLFAGLSDAGTDPQPPEVVPDDASRITEAIARLVASEARVVLVAGGTGISPQDETADAIAPLITTPLPGLTQALFAASLKQTPYAALSRAEAGLTADRVLLVSLAGSPNAADTTIEVLSPLLRHVLEQLTREPEDGAGYVEH
mgnify:CR=1 FL=1